MQQNQVTLSVSDFARSLAFYGGLGLELIVSSPPRYARFLCPGGNTLSLHIAPAPIPAGGVTVYFECDDVDARYDALCSAGYAFDAPPQDQPWLWREAYLRDPDGHPLCLFHAGENRVDPPWRLPRSTGSAERM